MAATSRLEASKAKAWKGRNGSIVGVISKTKEINSKKSKHEGKNTVQGLNRWQEVLWNMFDYSHCDWGGGAPALTY